MTGKRTVTKALVLSGGAGTRPERTTVRGPAIIGRDRALSDACIGPSTSIDDRTVVEAAEIEHSIVLSDCRITHLPARIVDSLVGRDVTIGHSPVEPAVYRFMVGDSSRIGLL